MDKQKIKKNKFPLLEAILLTPKESKNGHIGICTNTSAPGEVINALKEENRKHICVLGSLIVSRDGVERMIINSLAHPTLKYLILFSEESVTFAPSTNLLQAIMEGFDAKREGNYIKGGIAASPQYPNLNENILKIFSDEITVIPVFMYSNPKSKEIIKRYLEWLKPRISEEIFLLLSNITSKNKIYYDSLNKIIMALNIAKPATKNHVYLDPKEFQQLQPPTIELEENEKQISCPFSVKIEDELIRLDISIQDKVYYIKSKNDFLLAYSLMKFLKSKKKYLSPIEQLLLGAELGRVSLELNNKIKSPSFIKATNYSGKQEIKLEPKIQLSIDEKFYYRISAKDKKIRVLCMAFDICAEFFELVSGTTYSILEKIAKENRFDNYEMDILHRIDIGIQIGRAGIAAKRNLSFVQDLSVVFKINKNNLPFIIVDGDNFLDIHKNVLTKIYTEGITDEHGDPWKGQARTASVLAIYRKADRALKDMPLIYRQGSESTEAMRKEYKKELLRKDHDGTYTYGERTRTYFGFDQIEKAVRSLKKYPNQVAIIQRFDPSKDMSSYQDKDSGKIKYTHDPCLVHDLFFIMDKKLHSFHIARAHNMVNAYPENVFGLYDAYVEQIRNKLGLESGDMYMLSNRANILLITEEQRTKKIMSEPSKPVGQINTQSGPYLIGKNVIPPKQGHGVAYFTSKIEVTNNIDKNEILSKITNYQGINLIKKASTYLKNRGVMHNNPIITDYYPTKELKNESDRLIFFQANVFGKKIHGTAVFTNRSIKKLEDDRKLCNYIITKYNKLTKAKLGNINIIYVNFNK